MRSHSFRDVPLVTDIFQNVWWYQVKSPGLEELGGIMSSLISSNQSMTPSWTLISSSAKWQGQTFLKFFFQISWLIFKWSVPKWYCWGLNKPFLRSVFLACCCEFKYTMPCPFWVGLHQEFNGTKLSLIIFNSEDSCLIGRVMLT